MSDSLKMGRLFGGKPVKDPINPYHYNKYPIQPFEFLYKNGIAFPECDIINYLVRWTDKDGLEDLYKAKRLLEMLIEQVEEEEKRYAEKKSANQ